MGSDGQKLIIQTDEKGNKFFQNKNGQRHYLQPPNNISSNQSSIDESKIESNVSES